MRRHHNPCVAAALAAVLAAAGGVAAEPLSRVGNHDIGALLERAGAAFDLEAEDAVALLDSRTELWTEDGCRVVTRHTIHLIRTDHGLDAWADLRVPWDSAHQELQVETLSTWRLSDRSWTESGPTAVVDTLPVSYTHLRAHET